MRRASQLCYGTSVGYLLQGDIETVITNVTFPKVIWLRGNAFLSQFSSFRSQQPPPPSTIPMPPSSWHSSIEDVGYMSDEPSPHIGSPSQHMWVKAVDALPKHVASESYAVPWNMWKPVPFPKWQFHLSSGYQSPENQTANISCISPSVRPNRHSIKRTPIFINDSPLSTQSIITISSSSDEEEIAPPPPTCLEDKYFTRTTHNTNNDTSRIDLSLLSAPHQHLTSTPSPSAHNMPINQQRNHQSHIEFVRPRTPKLVSESSVSHNNCTHTSTASAIFIPPPISEAVIKKEPVHYGYTSFPEPRYPEIFATASSQSTMTRKNPFTSPQPLISSALQPVSNVQVIPPCHVSVSEQSYLCSQQPRAFHVVSDNRRYLVNQNCAVGTHSSEVLYQQNHCVHQTQQTGFSTSSRNVTCARYCSENHALSPLTHITHGNHSTVHNQNLQLRYGQHIPQLTSAVHRPGFSAVVTASENKIFTGHSFFSR